MNLLDLTLLSVAVLAALGGYRLGFLTRTVSWLGMAIGLVVAARALPWLLEQFTGQSPASLLLFSGVVLLGGSFIGQALGYLVGNRIRFRLPTRDWVVADHALGAIAGLIGVAAALWLMLPTMASAPGFFAEQTRQSVIARTIDRAFPPAPDTLVALRRLVGDDQFPQVFAALTPAPELGPPPADAGLTPELIQQVTPSTVKISGIACNRLQEGSGFVTLGTDVVITNAHVVAGEDEPTVERDDGSVLSAIVVVFDPQRDLAVLRVPGLGRGPLPLADGTEGTSGGVFGHPGGAPLRVAPFVVGNEVRAVGTDIYDANRTERAVLILSSQLRPGDSGGALVDGTGAVVGVAFAIAPDDPDVAYALDVSEVNAVLAGDLATPVDTGGCLR
jgi:S1-C subfamily serine protease